MENQKYLTKDLITYLGNKRKLLPQIEAQIKDIQAILKTDKTINVDLFSGSGSVARMMKQYSSLVVANDLEHYSQIINSAFLKNRDQYNLPSLKKDIESINLELKKQNFQPGIITANYAPKDDNKIKACERVFFTHENALRIDTIRALLEKVDNPLNQQMILALLLIEASIHNNTGGIFKGFYKNSDTGIGAFGGKGGNALKRIMAPITLTMPELSNYKSDSLVYQQDAKTVFNSFDKKADIVYLDPPYNQHPYASNYFMLNLIAKNKMPDKISKVSGIPSDWNRSNYNKRPVIYDEFSQLLSSIKSKYIILSYNNEGFLTYDQLIELLNQHGEIINAEKINYNAYRASRNLAKRAKNTDEYLFTVKMTK